MTDTAISLRLRQLKDQNGWTAQEMADLIGMSRRTLESYMRRENAPLPGVDALRSIAKGTGVSLDWLILGDEHALIMAMLLARLASERAALPVLQNLLAAAKRNDQLPLAEYLAQEIGAGAAEKARFIHESGATSVQIARLLRQTIDETDKAQATLSEELRKRIEQLEAAILAKS